MKRDTSLCAASRFFALTLGLPVLTALGQAHADEPPAAGMIVSPGSRSEPTATPGASSDVANIDIIQTQPVTPPSPPTSQQRSNGLIRDSHFDLEFIPMTASIGTRGWAACRPSLNRASQKGPSALVLTHRSSAR
jgi:hypothetical protein